VARLAKWPVWHAGILRFGEDVARDE